MSLWSFQGARGLLRTSRRPPASAFRRTQPVSQNSTAYVKWNRRGQRYFQASWRVLTVVETIEGASAYRSKSSGFPRKEVIQPQLPLRLPCYDFTPIICPTLGGWLLTVTPPTLGVTNFRGVTGGVYKAREHIHRGIADPRLLATPPSWRRVSASNPNRDRLFGIRSPSQVCSPLYRPM